MAIDVYLAITAAEMEKKTQLPPKPAWMSCHFSPGTKGLSNCPRELPEGSVLILDDSQPIQGHDPVEVRAQLIQLLEKNGCSALVLDFQRPDGEDMVLRLMEGLPCPAIVSALYKDLSDGPLLIPPVPPHKKLSDHLAPWTGRRLWLELAAEGSQITLTEAGAQIRDWSPEGTGTHHHPRLHCHYDIVLSPGEAVFHLQRRDEDLKELLQEGERLGITAALGLAREFPEFG